MVEHQRVTVRLSAWSPKVTGKQETGAMRRRATDRAKTTLAADFCLVQVEARAEGDAH